MIMQWCGPAFATPSTKYHTCKWWAKRATAPACWKPYPIHKIRATYPDMKILVISAYDDDVYVQGLLAAGVHGYHLKDQPLSDLQLAVQRILAGQKWVTSRLVTKLVSYNHPAARHPAAVAAWIG